MAATTRESRRRKILERGSERLAFITGQLQNMPPHSHPRPQTHIETEPHPPSVLHRQDPTLSFSTQSAVSPNAHCKASSFDANQSHASAYNGGIGEGSVEPSKDPDLDASGEANTLPDSYDQSSFVSTATTSGVVQHLETRSGQRKTFTPKQISSAIDASEKTRFLCSIIVAVLVLLSHLGIPILGNRFFGVGSIISFRPLYFILLTNVTLVIARLIFSDRGSSRRASREREIKAIWAEAEQVSKTLEVGLVAQKVIDAVFMDCSVYAIIVICGLSFI